MFKLDKKRFIRPIQEKLEASELVQSQQQAQLDEVLQNQDAQQTQLNEIQSLVELLLSLLVTDDAKKGEKVVKSKCSPIKILKKKDDHGDDQGNSDKSRGHGQGEQLSRIPSQQTGCHQRLSGSTQRRDKEGKKPTNQDVPLLITNSDDQVLKTTSDIMIQAGSQDSQKFLQTLKFKGNKATFFYKDPKIQIIDEELAKRLFLKDNPGVDLEELREEEAKFATEKSKPKSKASDAKKPPRPKEKGIVIKERSATEIPRSRTRSQTTTDPKDKGKGKVGEPVKKQKMKIPQILMDPVCKMVQVFDDTAAEDEIVETLKRKRITEEFKTTSNIAQVIRSEYISEQQATDETANPDKFIKTSTSDTAQVDIYSLTLDQKKKLLWNKATPVEPKTNLMLNQLATFGLKAKQARDKSGLGSDKEKIQIGVEVTLIDPFILTDNPYKEIKQNHLDKVLSAQIVMDTHDESEVKEKLILFLNDGRTYRLADSDVLKKSVKELQHIHYLMEVKSYVTRRWSDYILKVGNGSGYPSEVSGCKSFALESGTER
ncbi:hypothetical protein AgCh_013251 [Apium graveolens]